MTTMLSFREIFLAGNDVHSCDAGFVQSISSWHLAHDSYVLSLQLQLSAHFLFCLLSQYPFQDLSARGLRDGIQKHHSCLQPLILSQPFRNPLLCIISCQLPRSLPLHHVCTRQLRLYCPIKNTNDRRIDDIRMGQQHSLNLRWRDLEATDLDKFLHTISASHSYNHKSQNSPSSYQPHTTTPSSQLSPQYPPSSKSPPHPTPSDRTPHPPPNTPSQPSAP